MVVIWIFWEAILTVKANDKVDILTDKPFLYQNFLGQPDGAGGSRIHIDRSITDAKRQN